MNLSKLRNIERYEKGELIYLIVTSNNDVLWFWHYIAFLGHKGIFGRSWKTIGRKESIVLLHTERMTRQLSTRKVRR